MILADVQFTLSEHSVSAAVLFIAAYLIAAALWLNRVHIKMEKLVTTSEKWDKAADKLDTVAEKLSQTKDEIARMNASNAVVAQQLKDHIDECSRYKQMMNSKISNLEKKE